MRDTAEFLAGALVGTVMAVMAGMLWAPGLRRGSGRRVDRWAQRARVASDDIVDRFRQRLRQIKDNASGGDGANA